MKKVIPAIDRPSYREFGINDKVGRYCRWEDGVYIHNDGEGDSNFRCEIPRAKDCSQLTIGGLYVMTYGDDYSKIIDMKLTSGPNMVHEITWEESDGSIEEGYAHNFQSAIW